MGTYHSEQYINSYESMSELSDRMAELNSRKLGPNEDGFEHEIYIDAIPFGEHLTLEEQFEFDSTVSKKVLANIECEKRLERDIKKKQDAMEADETRKRDLAELARLKAKLES